MQAHAQIKTSQSAFVLYMYNKLETSPIFLNIEKICYRSIQDTEGHGERKGLPAGPVLVCLFECLALTIA